MKTDALIFGVRGQDGRLLCSFLKKHGLETIGCSRQEGPLSISSNLSINCKGIDYQNTGALRDFLKVTKPKYIFNFAGHASVGKSFEDPMRSQQSFINPLHAILEGVRQSGIDCRIFCANSGDVFGDNDCAKPSDAFSPKSPYAVARAYGANLCRMYREVYGLYIVNGFLFPHESELRNNIYFLPKLVSSLAEIKGGEKKYLELGNLDTIRDFGWAPEYINGFWLSLNQQKPKDFIFATGVGESLKNIVSYVFELLDLNQKLIRINQDNLIRPNDLKISVGNISDTTLDLDWHPKMDWKDVINEYLKLYSL